LGTGCFGTVYFNTVYFDTVYFDIGYIDIGYIDIDNFGTNYFDTDYFDTDYFDTDEIGTDYFDTDEIGTDYFDTDETGTDYFDTGCFGTGCFAAPGEHPLNLGAATSQAESFEHAFDDVDADTQSLSHHVVGGALLKPLAHESFLTGVDRRWSSGSWLTLQAPEPFLLIERFPQSLRANGMPKGPRDFFLGGQPHEPYLHDETEREWIVQRALQDRFVPTEDDPRSVVINEPQLAGDILTSARVVGGNSRHRGSILFGSCEYCFPYYWSVAMAQ
jgi:hypothetical protein